MLINALWQIQGSGQIVDLAHREGDPVHLIVASVPLFYDAVIIKSADAHIFQKMRGSVVYQRNGGGFKAVYYSKHIVTLISFTNRASQWAGPSHFS